MLRLNFDKKLEDFLEEDFDVIGCSEMILEDSVSSEEDFLSINSGEVFYKNCNYCSPGYPG